eukprot:5975772-Pyramimonas_sp.AAC.1
MGEEVDLSAPGPPFVTVFFLTARAMMTQGSDQVKEAATVFFQKHPKDKTPQYMASLARQFTARSPRGPGSKRTRGNVKLTLAIGPSQGHRS